MTEASAELAEDENPRRLTLRGDWTVWTIAGVDARLNALAGRAPTGLVIDLAGVGRIDVAGAYLIDRTVRALGGERGVRLEGGHDAVRLLIAAAAAARTEPAASPAPREIGAVAFLAGVGRRAAAFGSDALETLSFLGLTLVTLARLAAKPQRLRWIAVVATMERAGLEALPIIATLSFFIGLVVAYVGVVTLSDFGAAVFTVELVGFSVLREFAAVITAVLLAGRTDSAFTAEIGAMKMRQEIDAMRVLGLDVMERLVAPRVLAMTVATPLLTFVAMLSGLAGGLLVCWVNLGVTPTLFVSRIQESVGETHFWVGIAKAPVFGFVLAIVGCRHGLRVGGDVASLGRETTSSVVQAIFLVIVLDALFAIWFLELGL